MTSIFLIWNQYENTTPTAIAPLNPTIIQSFEYRYWNIWTLDLLQSYSHFLVQNTEYFKKQSFEMEHYWKSLAV